MNQNNRLWVIGSVTVMVAIVIAGWFLGIQPALAASAAAELERENVQAQNDAQLITLAQLADARQDQGKLEKDYATLLKSIPENPGTSAFIDGLDALATKAGVQITGFTVGDPVAYTIPQSAVPVAVADPTAPADGATAAPVAPPTTPSAPPAVTSPLITPDNFVGILIGIDVAGSYESVLSFVDGLQTGKRLFLVTGILSDRVADSPDASLVAAHITGYIYVLDQG